MGTRTEKRHPARSAMFKTGLVLRPRGAI
jgi:hypothetical protein